MHDNPIAGDQLYDVAPAAVSEVLVPSQIVLFVADAFTTGMGFTVTVTVAVFVQPLALVPVTVYVVVAFGVAVGFAQLVQERPVAGDHV